jgi:hypothetical protein
MVTIVKIVIKEYLTIIAMGKNQKITIENSKTKHQINLKMNLIMKFVCGFLE